MNSKEDLYDPYWFISSTVIQLENSENILHVHADIHCQNNWCPAHNRSGHGMRLFVQTWDPEKRMYSRVCEHGDSHPDPDWAWYQKQLGSDDAANHSCDGCCLGHYYHYADSSAAPVPTE